MTAVQFHLSWQEYYQAERFLHQKVGLFSVPLFRQWRLKARWKRKLILQAEHRATFSPDGIHYVMDHVESELDWRYFLRWAETNEGFLLIRAEDVFSLIPKRAFANQAQAEEFRRLLISKLRPQ
ncbi:MAG: YcxB family protein [Blastocatellia bacterium]